VLIPLTVKTNIIGFDKVIERACTTDGPDTFYSVLEQFIHQVQAEIIRQYDTTRRGFSRRKSADTINVRGKLAPSSAVDYSDALRNALNQPPRMVMVSGESILGGIVPENNLPFYWRFQEFGTRPFTHTQPFLVKYGAGGSVRFQPVRKALVDTGYQLPSGFRHTDLGLVKDIVIKHPGIKARNFLAYGKVYIEYNGGPIMKGMLAELLYKLVATHTGGK
jgi:hypothetical protein